MAENFRNKQWFKNMSQERKDEICKKFDIDEKTLRKAGRETEDGRIVIDILRIDHLLHRPEEWKLRFEALSNFSLSLADVSLSDIEFCQKIYKAFKPEVSFLKYKDNLHNNLLVKQAEKYTRNWYEKFLDPNATEEEKEFYSYQVWTHVRILLESDLNIVKSK